MNNKPVLLNFLNHLSLQNQPFVLQNNGKPKEWDDETLHQQVYNYNPELYVFFCVTASM